MSSVWKFFAVNVEDQNNAICNTCKGKIRRGGAHSKTYGTTKLIRHLKVHHIEDYVKFEEANAAKPANTAVASIDNVKKTKTQPTLGKVMGKEKNEVTTRFITEMMALDDQPFSMVENIGFKRMMKRVDPGYKIPNRKYFSDTSLPEVFKGVENFTRSLLAKVDSPISFTTDIWTSVSLTSESHSSVVR